MTDRGNAKNDRSRQQGEGRRDEASRDDAGTRGNTGAGAEASEGIHSTKGKRPEERECELEIAHSLRWRSRESRLYSRDDVQGRTGAVVRVRHDPSCDGVQYRPVTS